jgi:ABC-2 type transport system ATP-binding protein
MTLGNGLHDAARSAPGIVGANAAEPTLDPADSAEPAIRLRGVTKTFGPKVAVADLDLDIPTGRLIGLIGPNGAGKTTTIRMVMSILFADRGVVRVLGRGSAVESKDRIGYLPEERGLYKKMRVGAFLEFVARLKNTPGPDVARRASAWLDRLGLADVARKRCEELSKGMQQKVQFIASVIHEPDLLILDEPFSGLDPVNARLLRDLIHEQHARGCTVIFSTHQMSQAESLCDRIVMIHAGRKVLDNTPEEIRSRFDPRAVYAEPDWLVTGGQSEATAGQRARDLAASLEPRLAQIAPDADGIESSGRGLLAHLRAGGSASRLMAQLAAAESMRRVEVVRPTLEDVFISIVEGGSRAGADGAANAAQRVASRQGGDASGD